MEKVLINKDTKLFCSVSSHPGNFGATLYNVAFQELGIDAIYKPLKCENVSELIDIVRYAKLYSIGGISVSMPYKKIVLNLATLQDQNVIETGNANTLVFSKHDPAPAAYNTDVIGFEKSNQEVLKNARSATIVGKGAIADSIHYVLETHNIVSRCMNSRPHKKAIVDDEWLINASPIGMAHVEDTFFTEEFIGGFKYVSDVVVSKEPTNLIKISEKLGKISVKGWEMSLEQLCKQFEFYANTNAPKSIFRRVLKENEYV
jgi:shikimate dehydrogenase